jgi:ubiquinone/menaquinone biosynthesis C-methylase UbiE
VDTHDAVALIESAVGAREGIWAELGAGSGTFTRALATVLGPKSRIYAVDRDQSAVAALRAWAARDAANVIPVKADFTGDFDLSGLGESPLDGILLANALHFVSDAEDVLARLVRRVRLGGRVVVVEYEQRATSRWVPYPIPFSRWEKLSSTTGLSKPIVTATRPSEYAGVLYAAGADRIA